MRRRRLASYDDSAAADWVDVAEEVARELRLEGFDPQGAEDGAQRAADWELALRSARIPVRAVRVPHRPSGWALFVPPAHAHQAREELRAYAAENPQDVSSRPRAEPVAPVSPLTTAATLWVLAGLMLFHLLVEGRLFGLGAGLDWKALGLNDSALVLDGQWWRLVTALTLHADGPHVFGNVVIGGFFLALVCRELGGGLGWWAILLAGAGGNAINDVFHGPGHLSLGASTATFGAVGVLAGLRVARRQGLSVKRDLMPVVAGLFIVAYLGAGGGDDLFRPRRTDVGAHLFGFAAGLPQGWLAGRLVDGLGRPSRAAGAALGLGALGLVVLSWRLALGL